MIKSLESGFFISATLEKAESDFVGLAANKLRRSDFVIENIQDGLKIHKILFSNLYDWAGLSRTIDIFKGESLLGGRSIDYVYASYIDKALNDLNKEFQEVDWDVLESKEKIEKICYFVTEFWHIHPLFLLGFWTIIKCMNKLIKVL